MDGDKLTKPSLFFMGKLMFWGSVMSFKHSNDFQRLRIIVSFKEEIWSRSIYRFIFCVR
jgi:hypothetical protein